MPSKPNPALTDDLDIPGFLDRRGIPETEVQQFVQPVEQLDQRVEQAQNIFTDLAKLEVAPTSEVGAREILSAISVRRPRPNEFIQVDAEKSLTTIVWHDKDEGEYYFVAPAIREKMIAGTAIKMLVLAVNQIGSPFIWPVPVDDEFSRKNSWNESARTGFHHAKKEWTKLVSDRGMGRYRIFLAEGALPPPRFPDKPFPELLGIAFNNRVIDQEDHPIIKAMRGLTV